MTSVPTVEYKVSPAVSDLELNKLFSVSWPAHREIHFQAVLRRSMSYVCAYEGAELIGYVNVAWDGKTHAFVLDTTVHPSRRHQGIGKKLVLCALEQARLSGVTWVHVDFEPNLRPFYAQCGFRPSEAGVINVTSDA
ncbi:MAG: GNAT family N-acetyltransferase [Burkholderiales bacterium]|nr:MAG: GNAT family N-acetyltransferase [Burkholderiales bacterium]